MYITITSSQVAPDQLAKVEGFLDGFLPRLEQQPGVIAIYHYVRPEKGDETTIVIWENEEAVRAYRQGDLVKEVIAFEQKHNLPATREGYLLKQIGRRGHVRK